VRASLFCPLGVGNRCEIEAGLAGMWAHFDRRMLCEVSKQVRRAEDLGHNPVSFTEHHFYIEEFEVRTTRFGSTFTLRCRHSASGSARWPSCGPRPP
jgi:hypothetical protein